MCSESLGKVRIRELRCSQPAASFASLGGGGQDMPACLMPVCRTSHTGRGMSGAESCHDGQLDSSTCPLRRAGCCNEGGHELQNSRSSAVQLLVHCPHLLQGAGGGGVGLDGVLLAGLSHQLLGILGVGSGAQRQRPTEGSRVVTSSGGCCVQQCSWRRHTPRLEQAVGL